MIFLGIFAPTSAWTVHLNVKCNDVKLIGGINVDIFEIVNESSFK